MQSRSNFVRSNRYDFRQSADNVASAHADIFVSCTGISRTDFNFDFFAGSFANHQVIFFFNVKLDVAVEFVARHAQTFAADNSAQRNDSNVAGAAAYVDNHWAHGFGNVNARAQCRRYRFFNKLGSFRARLFGCFLHGSFFDGIYAGGNANHNFGTKQKRTPYDFFQKMANHWFGHFVIGNYSVAQRTNCHNVAGRATNHVACFFTYCQNFIGVFVDGNDRGFLQNNAFAFNVD